MSFRRSVGVVAVVGALAIGVPAPAGAEPPARQWRLTTVAGNGHAGYSGDGGPATEARLGGSDVQATHLAVAGDDTIYLAEQANDRLRRVNADGVIDTVPVPWEPRLHPTAMALAGDGTVYLTSYDTILRVDAGGVTEVSPGADSVSSDLTVDSGGNVYHASATSVGSGGFAGSVTRVDPAGGVTKLVDEPAKVIHSVAVDPAGTVYFTTGDTRPKDDVVHAVGADGTRRVAATLPDGHVAGEVTIGPDGVPHVVDLTGGRLLRVDPQGTLTQVGPALGGRIDDLAFGPDGRPYVLMDARVIRIDRFTGDEESPKPAKSRWAGDEPGTVHRVAGTGETPATDQFGLSAPAVADDGTVYVAEPRRNLVHAIGRDGRARRFAGTGAAGREGADLEGTQANKAALSYPHAVAVDRSGNVYIATEYAILRVPEGGAIDEVVEFDVHFGPSREPAPTNQLAVDDAGTLYYTDLHESYGLIRRVGADGAKSVLAGTSSWDETYDAGRASDNKPAAKARLNEPFAVSAGADGTVYFIESASGDAYQAVRAVRPDGVLVTVAGRAGNGVPATRAFSGDGGPATNAGLNNPRGVAAGPDGSFYIADTYNNRVRRVDGAGVITTIAGTGRRGETGDGDPATEATLVEPTGLTAGADGTVYVTSAASTRVRAIKPDGTMSTLADLGGSPAEQPFAEINALAAGPDDTVYFTARDGLTALSPDGKTARVAGFRPHGSLATGTDGSLYQLIQEPHPGQKGTAALSVLRRYPDGTVVVAHELPDVAIEVGDLAVGPGEEVYLTTGTDLVSLGDDGPKRLLNTLTDLPESPSDRPLIRDVTTGADGTPYIVVDSQVVAVRKGKPEVVAGNGEYSAEGEEDGGPARDAWLNSPSGIAVAEDGTVFVATGDGVRRVRDGVIETLGAGRGARQLAISPSGDLYAATGDRVDAVVAPAEVEIDRTSWTWLLVVSGALVLVVVCLLVLRHRKKRVPLPTENDE